MSNFSVVPNIRCTACGAVIGNKFTQFNTLIECGSTEVEAFLALDITQYCCRKDFLNPIVLSSKTDQSVFSLKRRTPEVSSDTETVEQGFRIDISEGTSNRLSTSIGKEIPIVSLSHSDSLNEDYLEDLKRNLRVSLGSSDVSDITFKRKDIDISKVFESDILPGISAVSVGSGFEINHIHKTYNAN